MTTSYPERKKWETAFIEAGITVREMYSMNPAHFETTCTFLMDSGIQCPIGDSDSDSDIDDEQLKLAIEISRQQQVPQTNPKNTKNIQKNDYSSSSSEEVDESLQEAIKISQQEQNRKTEMKDEDDDDALARALALSLEEEDKKSKDELIENDEEFARRLEQELNQNPIPNSSNNPNYVTTPNPNNPKHTPEYPRNTGGSSNISSVTPSRTISGQIRNEQNEEFVKAEYQARLKEIENKKKLDEEKKIALEREAREKKQKEQNRKQAKDALEALGIEPADGVAICVAMPSGKKITRKFDRHHDCQDLFVFVSGQDELFDSNENLFEYSLMQPGPKIEKGKTFEEVGITRRSMVNVILD